MAKLKTLSEAETARRRAVTGLRNLGRDDDADRFEDMSTEEYADEKGIEIVGQNPSQRSCSSMATRTKTRDELLDQIDDLQSENDDLQETIDDLQGQLDDIADVIAPEEEEEEPEEEDDSNGYWNSD